MLYFHCCVLYVVRVGDNGFGGTNGEGDDGKSDSGKRTSHHSYKELKIQSMMMMMMMTLLVVAAGLYKLKC